MPKQWDTRMRIVNATEKLLKSQPISEISVISVCRESGVSRTTFYTYFTDIFAVAQWLWDVICEDSLYKIENGRSWYDGHLALFEGLYARKTFFTRTFTENDHNSVMEYGYRKSLDIHIANAERRLGRPLTDVEKFELEYSVRSFSGMTTKWVREGMVVPPERMAALFDRFVPETFSYPSDPNGFPGK